MGGESPIFSKVYLFLLWLLNHTEHFPKSERFRMAKRLEDSAYRLHELLIIAARTDRTVEQLTQADIELDKLRHYLRLSMDRNLTSLRQYEHASRMLVEIGKLLGGWIKKEKASTGQKPEV